MPAEDKRDRRAPARLILLMRGLRQFSYGLLAVILGVVLTEEGFSPASIGVLITVSLVGDMAGTYPIGLFADSWGRRRTLALLMAATGAVFGLVSSYAVLLVAAFFGTLGTTASETAPFLPIDQAMLAQVTLPERRTGQFARYNLVASLSTAPGAPARSAATSLARDHLAAHRALQRRCVSRGAGGARRAHRGGQRHLARAQPRFGHQPGLLRPAAPGPLARAGVAVHPGRALKAAYDLTLWSIFRKVRVKEEPL